LSHYGERFRFDGKPLARAEFEKRMDAFVAGLPENQRKAIESAESYRTVFELLTAFALVEFGARAEKIAGESVLPQIVVWETGLGGRLDCTNVVDPLVSVITTLGIDHANILGDTIEKIAAEKAGIIKAGRPIILSRQTAEFESRVVPLLIDEAEASGSRLIKAWEETPVTQTSEVSSGQWIKMIGEWDGAAEGFLPLHGLFQIINLESAITATLMVAARFNKQPTCKELLSGLSLVDWPGRFEILQKANATLIIDGAHCPLSATALGGEISGLGFPRIVLLWGMQKEKNHRDFLDRFRSAIFPVEIDRVFCYSLPQPRGAEAQGLAEIGKGAGLNAESQNNVGAAFDAAMKTKLPVVSVGTLYSVAEIKERWSAIRG
ncbi:MAG: cyanophycin synthetase, partial [Candidatus Sumerlaeota bacterium]